MKKLELDTGRLVHVEGGLREVPTMPAPMPGGPVPPVFPVPEGLVFSKEMVDVPEYYMYEDIAYVAKPVDLQRQTMNIYIPAAYIRGGGINGRTAENAPVFFYIAGGGFRTHGIFNVSDMLILPMALQRGYVVISANFRGCSDCYVDVDGDGVAEYTGASPAQVVDLKAAIRYLRSNAGRLPGDYSKIIAAGSSSGGAMTALLGASGNTPRFNRYFEELGAAEGSDEVAACGAYFGPTDLGIGDMAYDWIFGRYLYRTETARFPTPFGEVEGEVAGTGAGGIPVLKIDYAAGETAYLYYTVYARMFVDDYIEGRLGMTEAAYVARYMRYLLPAYREYRAANPEKCAGDYFYFDCYDDYLASGRGRDPYCEAAAYPAGGGYINFDLFRAYTSKAAHKGSPSFDKLKKEEMPQAENALFGDLKNGVAHFTAYGAAHGELGTGELPDETARRVIDQNALSYIGDPASDCAPHWYIRHGTLDGDIPITLSLDLAELLKANETPDVCFEVVFNGGHGGDNEKPEVMRFLDWCEKALPA